MALNKCLQVRVMAQKYQVIARKYRPQTFREVVGQDAVVLTLKNAIRFNKIAHAYLFSGSRGVGKTTLARLFAKALNCLAPTQDGDPCNECPSCVEITSGQSLDVIEIDGASNRGIDDIRQINETVGYAPSSGRYKIYIIDEVHMLTKEAFNALLKTLEEPPEKAKFFFATTESHKVLPTIISRCQRFDLGRILPSQIVSKLEQITLDLGRNADLDALHQIATFSDGSLRDAESLFDQILCFEEGTITADVVRKALGLAPQELFFSLDLAFSEAKAAYAFELVDSLFQEGKDLAHFLEQLIDHYRHVSMCKILGESSLPPSLSARYAAAARHYSQPQCLYLLDYLIQAEIGLQKSASQRVALETILLHVIRSKNRVPIEVIVRKLSELEEALAKGAPEKVGSSTTQSSKEPATTLAPLSAQPPETPKPLRSTPHPIESPTPVLPKPPNEAIKTNLSLKPTPIEAPKQTPKPSSTPLLKKEEIATSEPEKKRISEPLPSFSKHMSHYETLMRFTAVELEGSFKHSSTNSK